MVDSTVVKELSGNDLLNNLLSDFPPEFLGGNFLSVLCRDNNSIDTKGNHGTIVVLVLNSDLSLGIWAQPRKETRTTSSGQRSIQFVRKHDRQGHVLLRFVSCVAEHDALVTSTMLFQRAVIKTLSNVRRLLFDSEQDVASLIVETFRRVIITDLFDGVADDCLVVEPCLGGDLPKDHDHASLSGGLTCDLGPRILFEASIKLE